MSSPLKNLFILTILVLVSQQVLSATQGLERVPINPNNPQNEIKHVGLLLLESGKADEIGYMKLPLRVLNENSLQPFQTSRFKKWDVYDVISNDFYFSVSIFNLGSVGLVRSVLYDYNTGKSKIVSRTLSDDQIPALSHTSYRYSNGTAHDITFEDQLNFRVENLEAESYTGYFGRSILSSSKSHDFDLNVNINVTFDQEGIAAVTPLDKSRQYFLYEINSGNLPVEGSLKVDGTEYNLNHENGAAGHTYARGIWTDNNYIVRARGQGVLENGKRISLFLNSGYGDTATSEATVDAFVVDRFSFKLNAVDVEWNERDLMLPMKFDSVFNGKKDFKECHVTFTPSFVNKQNVAGQNVSAENDLVVGSFSGYVTDYRNKRYTFDGIKGAVELIQLRVSGQ